MQQQPTQRQTLEELLARLEFKQCLIQRRIISTQVQQELLNQREAHQVNHIQNTQQNQQTSTTNQTYNNNSSNSEDTNSDTETNQRADTSDSNREEEDSDLESNGPDLLRLPDGLPSSTGDKVIILNPANVNKQGGVIVGSTPKRLQIRLDNGDIIL